MRSDDALPRRSFLGLDLRTRPAGAPPGEGLSVARVIEGGSAACAGVRPGDRLLALNGRDLADPRALVAEVRALASGAPLSFEVLREGARVSLRGEASPLPVERIAGAELRLGHVNVHEAWKQRTLLTIPTNSAPPYRTILFLAGLGTGTCELSNDPEEPMRRLLEGLSVAGFATMRVERSGVGDSEGPSCQTTRFFDEVAAYRAALERIAEDPALGDVFLFGHSVGGMIAPLLAPPGGSARGIVVFGTSPLRWVDCIVRATRRQRALAGMEGEALEAWVAAWSEMHASVCREGKTPREVFAERPELAWIEGSSCHGEVMFGRHVSFFQELERLDLFSLWRTVDVETLVLAGEYDYAAGPDEGEMIVEEIRAASPGRARYVLLPEVGHDMRRHASMAEAYANPREGRWDERVLAEARGFFEGINPSS